VEGRSDVGLQRRRAVRPIGKYGESVDFTRDSPCNGFSANRAQSVGHTVSVVQKQSPCLWMLRGSKNYLK